MSLPALIILVGLAYIVLFGGLSLLRREGLSSRFAIEALVITFMVGGLTALTGIQIHPIMFLIVLYLITMRVRLLVDIANFFAQRSQFERANLFYNLAQRLWPDQTGHLVIQVNQGTALLQNDALDEAIAVFTDVLKNANQGYLGVKYEAATHYNLGIAYRRKDMEPQARLEFTAVLDTWPASQYAQRAEIALSKERKKSN